MYKGHKYLDADSHILEPFDLWDRYLEPAFKPEMPITYVAYAGDPLCFRMRVQVGDHFMPRDREGSQVPAPGLSDVYLAYAKKGFTPDCYRDALDRTGIDRMIVYPSVGLYFTTAPSLKAAPAAAYCRAYNNWLHDFVKEAGPKLIGAGKVDLRDPHEAAKEARRCVKDLGFKAIMINPEPVNEYRLNDAFFDPLWSEMEDLDVALGVHAGAGNSCENAWLGYYFPKMRAGKGAVSFAIGNMMVSMTLILGGVLERHPRLRVAHLESGAGWVAFWLDRMQAGPQGGFRKLPVAGLPMHPVEYFQRQCYVSADPDDPGIKATIEAVGDANIVTATDFGHPEGRGWTHALDETLSLPIAAESKRKIMWDNAARLYAVAD